MHVPLLIKYPGRSAGRVETEPVALIDVFPTVLDFLKIPVQHRISGKSLRGEQVARPIFGETSRFADHRSVVTDGYKLIWNKDSDAIELYDLEADPLERSDLAETEVETARALKQMLMEWDQNRDHHDAGRVDLTPEDIRALEALGYLE